MSIVSPDPNTTCQDFQRRLDSFLDGEIDSHSMRAFTVHASHCPACAQSVEQGEKLSTLLESAVEDEVARVEPENLWRAIESRLEVEESRRWARLRAGWERVLERGWLPLRLPALAASAALAVLLVLGLWNFRSVPTANPTSASFPVANNHAQIERIDSSAAHVAVWSEPEEHTTAIWVASFEP